MDRSEQAVTASRGLTLVEMIVALGVFSLVIAALLSFLQSQGKIAVAESTEVEIQGHLRRGIEDLCSELADAQLTGLDTNGLWVTYMVPNKGTSGFPVPGPPSSGAGAGPFTCVYEFGARGFDNKWYHGGYYRIEFVDSTLSRDTIVESAIGMDLNQDGDMNDTYAFGQFRQTVYDAPANASPPGKAVDTRDFTWRCARLSINGGTYTGSGNGCFYLRQPMAGNNEQHSDTFTDTNGDNVYEQPETVTDTSGNNVIYLGDKLLNDYNGNGKYDEVDSTTWFQDKNNNNVFDSADAMQANNAHTNYDGSWTYYDGCLKIRLLYIDTSAIPYSMRVAQTKVHIRNQFLPVMP